MHKQCKMCHANYNTSGREFFCSVICKLTYSIFSNNNNCYFIINNGANLCPKIKYKNKLYDVRRLLWYKLYSDEQLKSTEKKWCSFDERCLNPEHRLESQKQESGFVHFLRFFKNLFKKREV